MVAEGRTVLYLVETEKGRPAEVTNWPGTLRFTVLSYKRSWHNIGGNRVDVWFAGPDGHRWHGYQIGKWNQVCRAKRTKERVAA
jgi:hypothetical protein